MFFLLFWHHLLLTHVLPLLDSFPVDFTVKQTVGRRAVAPVNIVVRELGVLRALQREAGWFNTLLRARHSLQNCVIKTCRRHVSECLADMSAISQHVSGLEEVQTQACQQTQTCLQTLTCLLEVSKAPFF